MCLGRAGLVLSCLGMFLLAVLPFLGVACADAVILDDPLYLSTKREVIDGVGCAGLKWAFTHLGDAIWMPLTWLHYMACWTFRPVLESMCPSVTGFRAVYVTAHSLSIFIHGCNAVLLWLFLFRLAQHAAVGRGTGAAALFLAAALWAVHPLRCESVCWIASLKDTLSFFWMMASLLAWVEWRTRAAATGCAKAWYGASLLFFLLGAMAKPSVMCFPVLAFLVDGLVLRKVVAGSGNRTAWVRPYLLPAGLATVLAALAAYAQTIGGAAQYTASVPLWYKLFNAVVSLGVYARNLFFPVNLAPQCQLRWPGMPVGWWWAMPVGVGLCLGVWKCWRLGFWKRNVGHALMLTGAAWFLLSIAPMLGVSGFGGHAFADRFTYIPAVGGCLLLMGALEWPPRDFRRSRFGKALMTGGATGVLAVLVAMCGCLSWRQSGHWENDGALWPRVLAVDGEDNFMAQINLAKWLYERRHAPASVREACRRFEVAFGLNRDYAEQSAIIYLFALGEAGAVDRLQEEFLSFDGWIKRKYAMRNTLDQRLAEGIYHLYRKNGSDQREGVQSARRIAMELLETDETNVPQISYFAMLAGEAAGDEELRARGRTRLMIASDPQTGCDSPVRFRFALR